MLRMRHGIYERQVSLRNIMLMNDPFDRDKGKEIFNSHALSILDARKQFESMKLNSEEKNLLDEIKKIMVVAYAAQLDLINASIYDFNKKITPAELQSAFETQEKFSALLSKMIAIQKRETKNAVIDAEQSYQAAKKSVYLLGGSALLIGIFVAIFIIKLTRRQTQDINKAMSELESSRESLEERVNIRTQQLIQARDQALAFNKSKDIFLANMSHELRTPLNIIVGYSELLEDMANEDDYKKIIPELVKIQNAANYQLSLVNSILDISKIEEGKLDINPVDFNIKAFIDEVAAVAQPLMIKNNNKFSVVVENDIGDMYSDNIRIRQVLLNLLSNAAKFTEQGNISLTVTKNTKHNEINFEVKDSGIGMPLSYMKEIFNKFTQEDSSTTRKYGGSGLGLSISKQLSELLKGDIAVISEKEKGSCFTLSLPVKYEG
ncbi:MAG: ATP-binding protein, partial [Gammaproteobacteria bacterium]|nr:ATP-binding protein [Gammaproteobacteria bacterium]